MRFGGSLLPFVGMVVAIVGEVSSMEVTKLALSQGINKYVIIVYSDALFLLITLPCSFIFDRSEWTPLTFSLISDFFLLAALGFGSQILAYVGLQYSSAKVGTSMLNLIPTFTFILAIIFRLEKVGRRSKSNAAKCIGTIVSISGAFVVTFYKGPTLLMATPSPQLFWVIGAVSFAAEAFLSSSFYILQTFVLKRYPTVITLGCCMGFFGIMMSTTFALMVVKDASAWKLTSKMGWIAILYTAISGSAARANLVAWCLSRTGPVYVSMFKPLAFLLAVIADSIFLGDALFLGSLIGGSIIVSGFYAVVWGKVEEGKASEDSGEGSCASSNTSNNRVPLLQNEIAET